MKLQISQIQKVIKAFYHLPLWLKFIIVITVLSLVINGSIWVITIIREKVTGETTVPLKNFESKYHGYLIKVPRGWRPYESEDGIGGDRDLIFESMDSGFNQSVLDIARIEKPDADLSQVVTWGQERAMEFQNTTMNSISQHNTALYDGVLLIYTIPEAGYEKREMECHDWVTYTKPYGYVIRLCTIPRDWKRLDVPFQKMIASFAVTNE